MRYWLVMTLGLVGGGFLIDRVMADLLPLLDRIVLILGILSLGSGRRMLQERLHRRV